jgi:hypothetical protein
MNRTNRTRTFLLGVMVGLLLIVPIVYAQQQPERIVIGVPVQIGDSQDSTITRIAANSDVRVSAIKDEPGTWTVTRMNDRKEYEVAGMLQFRDSHLSWASRTWADSNDAASARLMRNFYFLLKSFEANGNTACTIATEKTDTPTIESDQVSINCGRRTAAMYVSKYKEQEPTVSLDEQIK